MERTEIAKKRAKEWLDNPSLESDLRQEIESMDEETLIDAFGIDLMFGTGGLRGIIGAGTNRMNKYIVQKTTLGLYRYLKQQYSNLAERGIVLSFDCRNHSREFAKEAAKVLATNGVKVYLFSSLRPTPELSFAIRYLKAAGGIMVTASHNPPQYNGYKAYDEEGCQLLPDEADKVIKEVNKIKDYFKIEEKPLKELVNSGFIQYIDKEIDETYLSKVKGILKPIHHTQTDLKNIKIVFTPLHGTASVHLPKMLQEVGFHVVPVPEQMIPDPFFSTVTSPNPEEASSFNLAIELGKKEGADILIATDPDADRMGIAVWNKEKEDYTLLTGNQTGAIMLNFLAQFKERNKKGVVFNTIVSSNLARAICDKYDLELVQTLTGFKYIGAEAKRLEKTNKEFFFGYEESYGYVIEDFVRDKDSYQASLVLATMASYYRAQGKTLLDVLDEIYQEFGFYLESLHNIKLTGIAGKEEIEKIMRHFQEKKYLEVAGKRIKMIEDYDSGIRYINDKKEKLTLPKSLVIKYIFEDNGWFVLRPSGTEPKLKIYFAVVEKTMTAATSFIERLKNEILTIIERIRENAND